MNDDLRFMLERVYKTGGTFLSAAGTLLTPSSSLNVLKIHQYSLSVQGTLAFSLNDTKPLGGTVDFGGFLSGGVIASPSNLFNKPFIPYPNYLCRTTTPGSALCLGTYITAPTLGTVYFQCVYTDGDTS